MTAQNTNPKLFFLTRNIEDTRSFSEQLSPVIQDKRRLTYAGTQIALPEHRFLLDDEIIAGTLDRWFPVIDWLAKHLDENGILVFQHDDPLRELGLLARAQNRFVYALAFLSNPDRIFARDYPIFSSADFFIFSGSDVEDSLRSNYVPHYRTEPAFLNKKMEAYLPHADGNGPRILLVTYFSGADRTVSVLRTNYWHEQIPQIWPEAIVQTVTATPYGADDPRVILVPDLGAGCLLDSFGKPVSYAIPFLHTEKKNARNFSTLSHFWRISLENYFAESNENFDVVIISGNPFAVFDFAAFAKRRWSSRVILDYRDPFANNPRIQYPPDKRNWARYTEKGYNFQADLITAVNDACKSMVECDDTTQVVVTANGFDERRISAPLTRWREADGMIHFVHAGKFRQDNSPEHFIENLDKANHILHNVGELAGHDSEVLGNSPVEQHGFQCYEEVLSLISCADCGVVFVSETGFDTPTKMFDYLAHGLDILIISPGELRTGAAATLLEGLEEVYWVANTSKDLSTFLRHYNPSAKRRDTSLSRRFSRKASTEKLISEIRRLLSESNFWS